MITLVFSSLIIKIGFNILLTAIGWKYNRKDVMLLGFMATVRGVMLFYPDTIYLNLLTALNAGYATWVIYSLVKDNHK